MDYARYPDKRTLEVVGDRGSVELFFNDGILRIYDKNKKGFREEREPFIRDNLFVDQIETIIGMIQKQAKPRVTLSDSIEALRFSEAVIESAEEKRFIRLATENV
jgi:predicted dehydrogenase